MYLLLEMVTVHCHVSFWRSRVLPSTAGITYRQSKMVHLQIVGRKYGYEKIHGP